MFTKWRIDIKELSDYRFDEDGNLWKKPFTRKKRSYSWRMIKIQYPNRWKIGKVYYSQMQLRPHLIEDENPIEIYKTKEMPF